MTSSVAGRAVTGRPATSPDRPAGHKLAPSERLVGQQVLVRLRSGEKLRGRYVTGSRYEIQLLVGEQRVVVFKHAVDWIVSVAHDGEAVDPTRDGAGR